MRDPLPEIVSVAACGPSALKCGAARAPGYVIAVNDAYRHVRHDAVLSMDGRWLEHRVSEGGLVAPLYARRTAWSKAGFAPSLAGGKDEVGGYGVRATLFECDNNSDVFGDNELQLNGPNSGYCALNLAYVLRPRVVYLFGFDHSGGHFHPESEWRKRGEGCANTPRKFASWSASCYVARDMFDTRKIKVINTNRESCVRAFEFGDSP